MRYRRCLAYAVLLVLAGAVLIGVRPQPVGADSDPTFTTYYVERRAGDFVRQPDTLCAVASDTLVGPGVYCFGARSVTWFVQANAGACSTLTMDVSNNDSTWYAATSAASTVVDINGEYSAGDSLNTGGRQVVMIPSDNTLTNGVGITWRYCRAVVRRRIGWSPTTASSGPTVACRTRVDSLRWKCYVQRSAP